MSGHVAGPPSIPRRLVVLLAVSVITSSSALLFALAALRRIENYLGLLLQLAFVAALAARKDGLRRPAIVLAITVGILAPVLVHLSVGLRSSVHVVAFSTPPLVQGVLAGWVLTRTDVVRWLFRRSTGVDLDEHVP